MTRWLGLFLMGGVLIMAAAHAQQTPWERVDLRQVEVGGEIGRRIDITINNNLLKLDLENDFLEPFRQRNQSGGFVGLGMLLDSMVRLAAYSESPELLARKDRAVSVILDTQEDDGYIGICKPEARLRKLWDIHEMAYIIYGLAMEHRFFGNEAALKGACKAADYIMAGWHAEPEMVPGGGDITIYMAVTGLEPALIALYHATGEQHYLDFCTAFRKLSDWDGPVVLGRWGQIQGHAYAYMARCLAQLRLHRVQPDPALFERSHNLLDFLCNKGGLTIIGASGQHECWHDTQDGAANLGETCATAYMIRWLDKLMRLEGRARYGGLMERAIHNALFAAQSPDGRRIRYYSPFEGPRVYFDKDTYCCPCNFRRIIGELPQLIYYQTGDGAAVNLYTPSEARLEAAGVPLTLRQETDYPAGGAVTLHVDPESAARFTLALRMPAWCQSPSVAVNGEAQPAPASGVFYQIAREWKPGDTVELHFPMVLRLVAGFANQSGRAAVMYGPKVFCLNPALNPGLAREDLRLITLKPDTLRGPEPDASVHDGGLKCAVDAWKTTDWYPFGDTRWTLTLTEFPDPAGEAAYFHLPNPNDPALTPDPLLAP